MMFRNCTLLVLISILLNNTPVFSQSVSADSLESIRKSASAIGFGELDSMHQATDLLLRAAEASNNDYYQGEAYNLKGGIARFQGNYSQAITHLTQAITYFEKADSLDGRCRALSNIAGILYHSNQVEEALNYSRAAVTLARQLEKPKRVALCLIGQGVVEQQLGALDSAEAHLREAESLLRDLEDTNNITTVLTNLGSVYMEMGDFDKSLYYYREGRRINQQTGNNYSLVYSLMGMGQVYLLQQENELAKPSLQRALDLALEKGWKKEISMTAPLLAESMANTGAYEEAYRYQQMGKSYADSLVNISAATETALSDSSGTLKELIQLRQTLANKDREEVKRAQNLGWVFATFFIVLSVWLGYRLFMHRELTGKIQQRELEYQNRLTEYANQQRSISLRSSKLNEREKNLAPLESFRNQMYSVLTDNLRDPLVALISMQQQLVHDDISLKDARQIGKDAHRSTQKLLHVLQSSIYWIRLQRNGLQARQVAVENLPLLEQAMQQLKPIAESLKVNLINMEGESCTMAADPDLAYQALHLLTFNTLQASDPGSKVSIQSVLGENRTVFRIHRHETARNPLFQQYWDGSQLEEVPPSVHDSSLGITLWVALKLISLMEGSAWEEYEEGHGQMLKFALPLADVLEEGQEAEPSN